MAGGACGNRDYEDATPKRFLHTPAPPFNPPLPEGGCVNPSSATHGSKGRVAKATATEASPYGRGGTRSVTEREKSKEYPLRATPACHLERAKHHSAVFCESNPTRGGRRARSARRDLAGRRCKQVARPRFRMGLKPTALLRHAAKVRLA